MLMGNILIIHDMAKVIRMQTKMYLNLKNFQILSILISCYRRDSSHEYIFHKI